MGKIITLSEASLIAVHGVVLIHNSGKQLNVDQISSFLSSSRHHVAKIFQSLAKAKIVKSTRGPSGGFVLSVNPEELTLLDIYEVIEGPIEVDHCMSQKDSGNCKFPTCLMGGTASNLGSMFKEFLRSKRVVDFDLDVYKQLSKDNKTEDE